MNKKGSSSTAQSGDSLTYTLNLTVTGSSVPNIVVNDTLPASETFSGFVSSPAGTTTSSTAQGLLTWNLPSPLAAGNYQLVYQAQVNNLVTGGSTLTNYAQLTYPGGAPGDGQRQRAGDRAIYGQSRRLQLGGGTGGHDPHRTAFPTGGELHPSIQQRHHHA